MNIFDKLENAIRRFFDKIDNKQSRILMQLAMLDGLVPFEHVLDNFSKVQSMRTSKKDIFKEFIEKFSENAPALE